MLVYDYLVLNGVILLFSVAWHLRVLNQITNAYLITGAVLMQTAYYKKFQPQELFRRYLKYKLFRKTLLYSGVDVNPVQKYRVRIPYMTHQNNFRKE